MPRKPIVDLIGELRSWLPNYNHGPKDYPTLLWRILASMPGGDEAEDMGYEPFELGWQEISQLGEVLEAIQDKRDVEDLISGLIREDGEEGEVEESRRQNPMARASIGRGETVMRGPYEAMRLPDGQWKLSYRPRGGGHGSFVIGTYPSENAAMTAAADHERDTRSSVREPTPRKPRRAPHSRRPARRR